MINVNEKTRKFTIRTANYDQSTPDSFTKFAWTVLKSNTNVNTFTTHMFSRNLGDSFEVYFIENFGKVNELTADVLVVFEKGE